jgi:hemolysin D
MMGDRFPTLARHWQVLRAAWSDQNARDASARPQSDHEFLPAALEIMEKPPSPGLRYLLLGICGLFLAGLIWSIVGRVDVVAIATGRVVPSGNVKIIQPIETGSIRAIHVRNGQRVVAGQLLVELDPSMVSAEAEQAEAGLGNAQMIAARNAAIIAHIEGRPAQFVPPPGTSAEMAATQSRFVRAAIAEYEAQAATLRRQRAERAADLAAASAEIAKLEQTLPLIDRQLAAREEMATRGYYSRLRLLEYEQLRIEHVRNIDIQRANADRARAGMATLDAQIRALRETLGRTSATELANAEGEASQRVQEVARATRRAEYQQLRSPVSGTVQQLSISTIGGVVQPAQALMVIVPDDAEVIVEAQILNRDIGFVREGQPVRVKLEAYPFTDYGLIQGTVEHISRDAIDTGQAPATPRDTMASGGGRGGGAAGAAAGAGQGLVYAARIRLHRRTITVAGREQPIGPGLAVQAEIKTGERRIIQYLLSPIAQTLDEAGRER